MSRLSTRARAIAQAFLVVFLWSTSFIFIRWGLEDLPPLTFAGVRYFLAFLCLLPVVLRRRPLRTLRGLPRALRRKLVLMGLLQYTLSQSMIFSALTVLPGSTVTLMLNFATPIVGIVGVYLLGERPRRLQVVGLLTFFVGLFFYFTPLRFPQAEATGLFYMAIAILSTTGSSLLGRSINRSGRLPSVLVTAVTMGLGSALLLTLGFVTQGLPALAWRHLALIGWLAVVNTAFAFTLWNHVQRTLAAVEFSSIADTLVFQVALWEWVVFGMTLTLRQIGGMLLAFAGSVLVQIHGARRGPHVSQRVS
ncbi:MAG: DMT family transporter [Anaerolineae bacterium]